MKKIEQKISTFKSKKIEGSKIFGFKPVCEIVRASHDDDDLVWRSLALQILMSWSVK